MKRHLIYSRLFEPRDVFVEYQISQVVFSYATLLFENSTYRALNVLLSYDTLSSA